MSSKSKNNIRSQKKLKGYVVLLGEDRYSLALNYGPTLTGKAWGFDWIGRATVFKTFRNASNTVKHQVIDYKQKQIRIVPLKNIAVLIPEVNSKFKICYRVEPKDSLQSIKKRVQRYMTAANKLEVEVKQNIKMAKAMRKKAAILSNLHS